MSRPCSAAAVVLVALALGACKEVETETEVGYEPAKLESVGEGKRVTFTAEGARRVGLRTQAVLRRGSRLLVPYSALLYDAQGKTYVYTSAGPLRYQRRLVEVAHIEGDRVFLSSGPGAGTRVVTTGVTEVYGTELEVPSH